MTLPPSEIFDSQGLSRIQKALEMLLSGKIIGLWEVPIILGLETSEIEAVIASWPEVDLQEDIPRIAIRGTLSNLIGYPHGKSRQIEAELGCSIDVLKNLVALVPKRQS